MQDREQLKKLLMDALLEKGDISSVASMLGKESEQEEKQSMMQLLKPFSGFADIIVQNSQGVFMDELRKKVEESTDETAKELLSRYEEAQTKFEEAVMQSVSTETERSREELLIELGNTESRLETAANALISNQIQSTFEQILPELRESGKLTTEEIEEIEDAVALSVESQIPELVSSYVQEQGITVNQIQNFGREVQKLIPNVDFSKAAINWNQIKGAPQFGGVGLGQKAIIALINEYSSSLPDQTGNSGKFLTTNGTDPSWATLAGGGDMTKAVYDPNTVEGDAFSMDNMVEGTDTKILTAAERTAIAANSAKVSYTDAAKVSTIETNADVTDTINVTAAGAEMTSRKNTNNGYAGLDAGGKINPLQLPALAISETFVVASQAAMLALTAQTGDVAVRTDTNTTFILRGASASTLADWELLRTPTDAVQSVAGKSGVVTLDKSDVGLGNVDNTSDANKPVSTAQQTALDGKVPITGFDQQAHEEGFSIKGFDTQTDKKIRLFIDQFGIAYIDASGASTMYLGAGDTVATTRLITMTSFSGLRINNSRNAAMDFRVNGTEDGLIFADASLNRVGIGTLTPSEKLDVDGNIKGEALILGTSALGNLGTTEVIDWSSATHFTGTLDQACTITHSNETAGQKITMAFTGEFLPTFSDIDQWGGGTAPTAPGSGETLLVTAIRLGTTVYGSYELFS